MTENQSVEVEPQLKAMVVLVSTAVKRHVTSKSLQYQVVRTDVIVCSCKQMPALLVHLHAKSIIVQKHAIPWNLHRHFVLSTRQQ
jgi:hypothetical protein